MIGDFLEHLMWEVRISDFELNATRGTTHPEFVEQLQGHIEKYGTSLLPVGLVDTKGKSKEEIDRTIAEARAEMRERYRSNLEHLEALRSLFEEAINCARSTYAEPT